MFNVFSSLIGRSASANTNGVSPITLPLNVFSNGFGSLLNNPLTQGLLLGAISTISSGLIGSIVGTINPAPTR